MEMYRRQKLNNSLHCLDGISRTGKPQGRQKPWSVSKLSIYTTLVQSRYHVSLEESKFLSTKMT